MNKLKRLVTLAVLSATLGTSLPLLNAANGEGYEDSYRASSVSPTVALGTVAVVAGIAILIHNRKRHHHHGDGNGGGDGGGGTHGHSHG